MSSRAALFVRERPRGYDSSSVLVPSFYSSVRKILPRHQPAPSVSPQTLPTAPILPAVYEQVDQSSAPHYSPVETVSTYPGVTLATPCLPLQIPTTLGPLQTTPAPAVLSVDTPITRHVAIIATRAENETMLAPQVLPVGPEHVKVQGEPEKAESCPISPHVETVDQVVVENVGKVSGVESEGDDEKVQSVKEEEKKLEQRRSSPKVEDSEPAQETLAPNLAPQKEQDEHSASLELKVVVRKDEPSPDFEEQEPSPKIEVEAPEPKLDSQADGEKVSCVDSEQEVVRKNVEPKIDREDEEEISTKQVATKEDECEKCAGSKESESPHILPHQQEYQNVDLSTSISETSLECSASAKRFLSVYKQLSERRQNQSD